MLAYSSITEHLVEIDRAREKSDDPYFESTRCQRCQKIEKLGSSPIDEDSRDRVVEKEKKRGGHLERTLGFLSLVFFSCFFFPLFTAESCNLNAGCVTVALRLTEISWTRRVSGFIKGARRSKCAIRGSVTRLGLRALFKLPKSCSRACQPQFRIPGTRMASSGEEINSSRRNFAGRPLPRINTRAS